MDGRINFISGNPFVEVTKGVIHLYKLSEPVPDTEMMAMLGVPAKQKTPDLLQLTAPCHQEERREVLQSGTEAEMQPIYTVLAFHHQQLTGEQLGWLQEALPAGAVRSGGGAGLEKLGPDTWEEGEQRPDGGERKPTYIVVETILAPWNESWAARAAKSSSMSRNTSKEGTPCSKEGTPGPLSMDDRINFIFGNPFVEVTKGVIHLYKLSEPVPDMEMMAMLGVPTKHKTTDGALPPGPRVHQDHPRRQDHHYRGGSVRHHRKCQGQNPGKLLPT
jgi:hypothetical protein